MVGGAGASACQRARLTGESACPTFSIASTNSGMPLPSVATVRRIGTIEALGVEFQFHALRAGTIGLVDHEDIGDLHDAGLDRLHIVTHARDEHHHGYLRDGSNLDFVLPDADRLDDDVIPAGGVHQARQIGGRPCNATHGPAGGHRADEDSGVGVVLLHADAIAQNGAAGGATARVHGEDGDGLSLLAQFQREGVHQRALSRSRRAGDTYDASMAASCLQLPQCLQSLVIAILDPGGQTRQGTRIPLRGFFAPGPSSALQ